MKSLSISFTLGKQSKAHSVNIEHNNRDFLANNIDSKKLNENIKYITEDPEKAYEKLFSDALKEYNEKQKQPCRRIRNYFEHIQKSNREEAFYEAVIQYGDKDTAAHGTATGDEAKKMLDEYMKGFQERNPNLYVFNAIMHNDEATPHIHLDFIPFYTEGRQKGLSKGVSLKAALNEQGFTAKNYKQNRLVAWEESERNAMEKILNAHGFEREDKNAKYIHMNVNEYKLEKEETKMRNALAKIRSVSDSEISRENVSALKAKLAFAENKNQKQEEINKAEYVPCYYSSPDKLAHVLAELNMRNIDYFETDTGFEIKSCYIDIVRAAEKNFKPVRSPLREQLRNDIDRLLLSSDSVEMLLEKLQEAHYEVKHGKYISVRPEQSDKFIRLKSLGEFYNELALKNRIAASKKFEADFNLKFKTIANYDTFERYSVQTICVYFVGIKQNKLPCKKINAQKPFSWRNDAELDKLLILNQKINSGVTLESLRRDFEVKEEKANEIITELEEQKKFLSYLAELKTKIEVVYENKSASPALISQYKKDLDALEDFRITSENYSKIYKLINGNEANLKKLETEFHIRNNDLKDAAEYFDFAQKVASGTYVQELAHKEKIRRVADYVPKGFGIQ